MIRLYISERLYTRMLKEKAKRDREKEKEKRKARVKHTKKEIRKFKEDNRIPWY